MARHGFLLLAFSLASACSDSDGRPAPVRPLTVLGMFEEHAAIVCEKLYTCCTSEERGSHFIGTDPPPTSEAECRDLFIATSVGWYLDPLVQKGTVAFDPEAAAACLDEFRAAACSDPAPSAVARLRCPLALHGTLAVGEPCEEHDECTGFERGTHGCSETCVPLPVEGEACALFGCAEPLTCIDDRCEPRRGAGAPCTLPTDCQRDHFCAIGSGGDGTCQAEAVICDGN